MVNSLILLLASLSLAHAEEKTLTLSELVRMAAERSPEFLNSKTTEEIRELEWSSARAKFLPSLDLSATHGFGNANGLRSTVPGTSAMAPWTSQLSLGVSETLYDNGESLTRLSMAELQREVSRLNALKLREELALEVSREFYRFSLNHHLIEAREIQKKAIEKQFDSLSTQYRQGLKTKQDFLRLKAQLQRAILDLASARKELAVSQVNLRKLVSKSREDGEVTALKFSPLSAIQAPVLPGPTPDPARTYLARMRVLENLISDKTSDLVRRRYWPQVSLTAAATYGYRDYIQGAADWSVLLTVKYNLWDWGIRRHDAQIADRQEKIDFNVRETELISQKAKIENLMLDLKQQSENLKLYEELLRMEEESYLRMSDDYREGRISYLDLVNGMDNLLNARVSHYRTYYDLLERLAEARSLEGTLYEAITQI